MCSQGRLPGGGVIQTQMGSQAGRRERRVFQTEGMAWVDGFFLPRQQSWASWPSSSHESWFPTTPFPAPSDTRSLRHLDA